MSLREDFKKIAEEKLREGVWGSYGDFRLVGHGKVTNEFCGRWVGLKGCLNVEGHNKTVFDEHGVVVNYANKVFVKHVHNWCFKPSCPVCFEKGWALREAGKIEARLREASNKFGLVEHIVVSVSVKDFGLEHGALRRKVIKVLAERGVIGGNMIFHGFRLNKVGRKYWYFSPHFHVLGYVLGGYKCRGCKRKWNCRRGCGGFDDRNYECFLKDGYFVKVLGRRKTVFGTAWYQLNHSSYRVGVKRFHIATWFGVCSYRKLKVTVEKRKELCPICSEELCRVEYCGSRHVVKNIGASGYERSFWADYEEDGAPVWFKKRNRGSGSYEE